MERGYGVPGRSGNYLRQPDKTIKTGDGLINVFTPISDEQVVTMKAFALEQLRKGHFLGELPEMMNVGATLIHWWRMEDLAFNDDIQAALKEGAAKRHEDWKDLFLAAFEETSNVAKACRNSGVSRLDYARAMRDYPDFRRAVNEIRQEHLDNVEEALYDKAMSGGKGSETAAIMLLNAYRPKRYKGKGGNPNGGDVHFTFIVGSPDEPKKLPPQTGTEIVLDD